MTYKNNTLKCDVTGKRFAIYFDGKWTSMGWRHLLDGAVGYDNGCHTTCHHVDDFVPCDDPENEHVKDLARRIEHHREYRFACKLDNEEIPYD